MLRELALDEDLKRRVADDPALRAVARRVARRYVAGDRVGDALLIVAQVNRRGDAATVDYMGESCRSADEAVREADVFLDLATRLAAAGARSSISLDLSHIGLVVDEELGYAQAVRIAEATAEHGQEMIISMEGTDRTDAILRLHRRLCRRFTHVGVTVQARLHRTRADLPRLLDLPGRIRLVKGAYPAAEEIAHPRDSDGLREAYLTYARALLASGHPASIATHDRALLDEIERFAAASGSDGYEFETLYGIGGEHLERLRAARRPTREYVVFGDQWWLYTCNRIAEDPSRLLQALVDAAAR
ncbi:proline dehydrogenase family protein [Micromonospora sp. R77]|uniref:proline dehydrogenase family protein n=1 Tax=Micromonospora sp. R77 TaxID=2925836 RepID=UPI001F616DE5|nr:proline dehydrogenase family protein [Micromonospora sp. R77]MCI4061882.1 proline dehydrogenase family protein [Micromonospora sp. R77]